ncbi:hypothetical protein Aple_070620 [Acrocarpospora pleiomorpha]|uniref:VOC domain-containing protein n=1 Tax=Acrocarpospora pleiomorpha TaxID=90975 RepID=A0A5M3XXL0_9ACTN|nr:VOC family protein [Acrocarpospora pleiomorpha]GES24163.1 hypothetical protein Aple_070620 [Acrocarpospora pleiomorpha]
MNGQPSTLGQVAQRAHDLDRATTFYRDILGLRHIATYDPPGLVFFDLGNTRLLIEKAAPSARLYLRVTDIHAAIAHLKSLNVEIVEEPQLTFTDGEGTFGPPGAEVWIAAFTDSEGNVLCLIT